MRKLLIIVAVPAMFFLGCKPKPTTPSNTTPAEPKACFTISKALIDSGETVTTTNCSTHATSYAWNFGFGLASDSSAPRYTYTVPARGTVYKVSLVAFGSGTTQNEKDTTVTIGYRRIDSVVVKNIPGFAPTSATTLALEIFPASNSIEYNSPQITPTSYPFTFKLDGLNPQVFVTPTTDQGWKGRIINATTTMVEYTFGASTPVYFSRNLDVDPIVVTDGGGLEMDFYYSLSPTDK